MSTGSGGSRRVADGRAAPIPRARWVHAFGVLGAPVLVTAWFALCYVAAESSNLAPSGDNFFAWMPLIYPLVVGPFWVFQTLLGLPGLLRPSPSRLGYETATAVFGIQALLVPAVFGLLPAWGSAEGFPCAPAVVLVAACGALVSLTPTAVLFRGAVRRRELPRSTLLASALGSIGVTVAFAVVLVPPALD